jgi:hypothetical protein
MIGRIDLIVRRVIIMGRLSSRGGERIWPCAGVWLLGAGIESTRGGESASHPNSKLAARHRVLQRLRSLNVERNSSVCIV